METVRTIVLAAHLIGLVSIVVSLACCLITRLAKPASQALVIAAILMGVTGLVLIAVSANLDLVINGPKLGVKAVVLITIVVIASRLRSAQLRSRDGAPRPVRGAGAAAIAVLVVTDVVIAYAWN